MKTAFLLLLTILISNRSKHIRCQTTTNTTETGGMGENEIENNNDNNRRVSSYPANMEMFGNYTLEVDLYSNSSANYTPGDEETVVRSLLANSIICTVCILIIVLTVIGNSLVVLAVTIVRKLHTEDNANNYLLVSLAVSDFFVGTLVMPFALYVELKVGNK
jgi:hypothetical protein